jgi:hypothetical protein
LRDLNRAVKATLRSDGIGIVLTQQQLALKPIYFSFPVTVFMLIGGGQRFAQST